MEKKSKKKNILKEIENELDDERSPSESDKDFFGRRTSYYVEENERILNLLITNCEPILQQIVNQVDHFNSYNKIQRATDKSNLLAEDVSVKEDCVING